MKTEPDFDARKDDRPLLTEEYDIYLDWLDKESRRHNMMEDDWADLTEQGLNWAGNPYLLEGGER